MFQSLTCFASWPACVSVDAKSERVAAWYASYDAVPLADKPLTLVMALATFEADLKAGGHL